MSQEVATLRRDIREMLKDFIKQIDDLVVELLRTEQLKLQAVLHLIST